MTLAPEQINYAATDAWLMKALYGAMVWSKVLNAQEEVYYPVCVRASIQRSVLKRLRARRCIMSSIRKRCSLTSTQRYAEAWGWGASGATYRAPCVRVCDAGVP